MRYPHSQENKTSNKPLICAELCIYDNYLRILMCDHVTVGGALRGMFFNSCPDTVYPSLDVEKNRTPTPLDVGRTFRPIKKHTS